MAGLWWTVPLLGFLAVLTIQPVSSDEKNCGVYPDFKPCVGLKDANRRLKRCCRRVKFPKKCMHLCKYDLTEDEAYEATYKNHFCGLKHLRRFLICAAGPLKDNRECCVSKKKNPYVALKLQNQYCLDYCNPSQLDRPLPDKKKTKCAVGLHHLMDCHHAGLR